MRHLQALLLVVGGTALGASTFGLGVFFGLAGWPSPPGIAGVGVAGLAIIAYAIGILVGAIVGFAAAVVWVVRRKGGPWTPAVWCGVALGVLTGPALHVVAGWVADPAGAGPTEAWPITLARNVVGGWPGGEDLAELVASWPVAAVLTPALGLLGGLLGRLAGLPWERRRRREVPHPPA